MIQLESAEKFYTTRTLKTLALRDINLRITAGEFVSIMGPSGSGKTTLLNVLGMFETLDAGRLQLAQHDITRMHHGQKVALRRKLIGYIFQSFDLIDFMSVYKNIELPLKYRNLNEKLALNKPLSSLDYPVEAHTTQPSFQAVRNRGLPSLAP